MVRLMTTPSPLRTLWHAAADAAEEEDDEDDDADDEVAAHYKAAECVDHLAGGA